MASANWPYVQLGPIGTNRHVSGLSLTGPRLTHLKKDRLPCDNCE